jgi:hypothetical protein
MNLGHVDEAIDYFDWSLELYQLDASEDIRPLSGCTATPISTIRTPWRSSLHTISGHRVSQRNQFGTCYNFCARMARVTLKPSSTTSSPTALVVLSGLIAVFIDDTFEIEETTKVDTESVPTECQRFREGVAVDYDAQVVTEPLTQRGETRIKMGADITSVLSERENRGGTVSVHMN